MIKHDRDLTPQELAQRRKAQQVLMLWPVAIAGVILLGATTSFLNDLPAIWRGLIYLAVCFAIGVGVVTITISLISRLWKMAAINAGCMAAATLFLVIASFGSFGAQFPRTVSDAIHIIGA